MHNTILQVFKILLLNIVLLTIASVVIWMVQFLSINSQVNSLMSSMSNEVSKNNRLPQNSAIMYNALLNNIVTQSRTGNGDDRAVAWSVCFNYSDGTYNYSKAATVDASPDVDSIDEAKKLAQTLQKSITDNGGTGIKVTSNIADGGNYGDVAYIHLVMNYKLLDLTMNNRATYSNILERTGMTGAIGISVSYDYAVPCLKYLKTSDL
jgi:hypothetical protein